MNGEQKHPRAAKNGAENTGRDGRRTESRSRRHKERHPETRRHSVIGAHKRKRRARPRQSRSKTNEKIKPTAASDRAERSKTQQGDDEEKSSRKQ